MNIFKNEFFRHIGAKLGFVACCGFIILGASSSSAQMSYVTAPVVQIPFAEETLYVYNQMRCVGGGCTSEAVKGSLVKNGTVIARGVIDTAAMPGNHNYNHISVDSDGQTFHLAYMENEVVGNKREFNIKYRSFVSPANPGPEVTLKAQSSTAVAVYYNDIELKVASDGNVYIVAHINEITNTGIIFKIVRFKKLANNTFDKKIVYSTTQANIFSMDDIAFDIPQTFPQAGVVLFAQENRSTNKRFLNEVIFDLATGQQIGQVRQVSDPLKNLTTQPRRFTYFEKYLLNVNNGPITLAAYIHGNISGFPQRGINTAGRLALTNNAWAQGPVHAKFLGADMNEGTMLVVEGNGGHPFGGADELNMYSVTNAIISSQPVVKFAKGKKYNYPALYSIKGANLSHTYASAVEDHKTIISLRTTNGTQILRTNVDQVPPPPRIGVTFEFWHLETAVKTK